MAHETVMPPALYDSTDRKYVHAIVSNGTLRISGQVATDEQGDTVGDDIETQTRQVFENIGHILDEVDLTFEDVVKFTSYLTDVDEDYEGFKSVYGDIFDDAYPCHTVIGVDALAKEEFLIEVECIAPVED
jgi:enamine deaminase RidA (YjgF/YER057c/UK114 family)